MPEFKKNTDFQQTSAVKKMEKVKQDVLTRTPMPYTPFRMKAADYENSPMRKNYGQFGVGSSESPQKISPLRQKGRLGTKTGTGAIGETGGGDAIATGMSEAIKTQKVIASPTGAPGGAASAGPMFGAQGGSSGGVGMHGDESHQGGGAIGQAGDVPSEKDPTGKGGKGRDRVSTDQGPLGGAAGGGAGAGAGAGGGGGPSGALGMMGKGKNR